MRHAPPVSVLCCGRGWRAVQSGLIGLCTGVTGAWLVQHLGAETALAAATACAAALPAAVLAWRLAQPAPVTLRWDGQTWQADGQAVQLALMLDLGSALVLRWQPAHGDKPRWTAVSFHDAGPAWRALRTALHARPAGTARKPTPW